MSSRREQKDRLRQERLAVEQAAKAQAARKRRMQILAGGAGAVRFSSDQIGPYKVGNGNVLEVYVNGERVSDPVNVVLQAHDLLTVGYGKPGSFPTSYSFAWQPGL